MNSEKHFKTIVVIPCYNVEKFCKPVIEDLLSVADQIIAVDDGSFDGTNILLNALHNQHPDKITVISFKQNKGKGFALIKGFEYAIQHFIFDALVTIDSDGQHRPCDIPDLIKPVYQGADLVIGERSFATMPFRSKIANTFMWILLKCIYLKGPRDTQSGMRAFSHSFAKEVVHHIPGGHYEMEFKCLLLALKEKKKIASFKIPTIYINKNKSSHFSVVRDSIKILKVFIHHIFNNKK